MATSASTGIEQALARCAPSDQLPMYFQIFTEACPYPSYSIWYEAESFHLQSTDTEVPPSEGMPSEKMTAWLEAHFPALSSDFQAWRAQQPLAEAETPELNEPVATVNAEEQKMVIHFKELSLYAKIAPDLYHFTFGATRWEEGKSSPSFCEFSLRHVYVIDKALPIMCQQIDISEEQQKAMLPEVARMKEWLYSLHVKPPEPKRNLEAGQALVPQAIKTKFHFYTNQAGNKIKGIASQDEYNAIQQYLQDDALPPYELNEAKCSSWEWVQDDLKNIFILYYGGKKRNILGSGGFSEVRYCQNLETGGWFAVKIQETAKMSNEKINIEEFLLGEQNIFYSTAVAKQAGKRFTFQKIIPGHAISKFIRPKPDKIFKSKNKIDRLRLTCEMIEKLLASVMRLHDAHYLHRDIKMENIIFTPDNQELTLIDYGAAEQSDKKDSTLCVCHEAHPVTTTQYNAPELARPKMHNKTLYVYTEATEMYAVGKIICELSAGIEGFDVLKYKADILGEPDKEDKGKLPRLMRYVSYWITHFNPDKKVKLSAEDFFDKEGKTLYPYSTARNHTAIRTLMAFHEQHPKEQNPEAKLWHLAASMVADASADRPSFKDALHRVQAIKKQLKKKTK